MRFLRFEGRQAALLILAHSLIVRLYFGREFPGGIATVLNLRTELSVRSLEYATRHGFLHERTDGAIPSILFGCDEEGRHGNFHAASYEEIRRAPAWAKRL